MDRATQGAAGGRKGPERATETAQFKRPRVHCRGAVARSQGSVQRSGLPENNAHPSTSSLGPSTRPEHPRQPVREVWRAKPFIPSSDLDLGSEAMRLRRPRGSGASSARERRRRSRHSPPRSDLGSLQAERLACRTSNRYSRCERVEGRSGGTNESGLGSSTTWNGDIGRAGSLCLRKQQRSRR